MASAVWPPLIHFPCLGLAFLSFKIEGVFMFLVYRVSKDQERIYVKA